MVIAHEWDRQSKLLKPHSLPMVSDGHARFMDEGLSVTHLILLVVVVQTSLASRAIDGLSDPVTKAQVIQVLNRYLHTDTVW